MAAEKTVLTPYELELLLNTLNVLHQLSSEHAVELLRLLDSIAAS